MKIKEFSITRYGPLPDTGRIELRNFHLFWGKNEDGKTLTIDALVKLLLGKQIKDFKSIDRVEEIPEGYVIILDDKDKEIKLPEKGDLTKVADLTSSECRNIFIIRNSDLSIAPEAPEAEGKFYTNVTDRLTGLRTGDISKIKKKLQDLGKLTRADSRADLNDQADDKEYNYKIKSRVNNAQGLIKEIEGLQEKIKTEKFDELEEESVRQSEEIKRIEQEIQNLDDARKREKYEKCKEALDKLKDVLQRYKQLEIYNENDEQSWKDYENNAKTYGEEKDKSLKELQKNEEEFRETSEKLSEVERDFRVFDDRKKRIGDEVKPVLKNYEMGVGKVKSEETKNRFYTVAAITSAGLLSISMLVVIMNPSPILYGLLVSFLISTIFFAALIFSFTQKKAHFAGVFDRIRLDASKFELDAESPKEIYLNIQKFDEEYQKKHEELQNIKRKKENLEEKIKEIRDKNLPSIEDKIKGAEDKVDSIKRKSGEESLEEYTKKLKSKGGLEKFIGEQKSVLKSHLGEKSEELEENISYWDEEIGKLGDNKDKAKDKKYSENAVTELKWEKQEFEEKLKEINNRMVSLQKEMGEVERKANEILLLKEESLYYQTSVDMEEIRNKLKVFIDEIESKKDNVLKVMKIFEELEAEEKEKVSELFGKNSPISKYFNKITDGLYEEVTFNQEKGKIEVKRVVDGKILGAEKLSGGAYDQLYFSIRLALGEKLLKEKGFFILDDPFVKADPDRLKKQIETLKSMTSDEIGWQVIYFSAKGEINDALKEDVDSGAIHYVRLQGIFS